MTALSKSTSTCPEIVPKKFNTVQINLELIYMMHLYGYCYVRRHCDEQGSLVHIPDVESELVISKDCSETCTSLQILYHDLEDFLWLRFSSGSIVELSPSFIPILAGRYPDGRPAYLATAYFHHTNSQPDCCVCEGMKPEDLRVRDYVTKQLMVPDAIGLAVMRHRVEDYPIGYTETLNDGGHDGVDATGPFKWYFERNFSRT